MILYDQILLTLNKPNLNGRTYTTEVVQDALNNSPDVIYGNIRYGIHHDFSDINRISHRVDNMRILGDNLIGDVTILDTDPGKLLAEMKDYSNFGFRCSSYADVTDDRIISNMKITSCNFVENPA